MRRIAFGLGLLLSSAYFVSCAPYQETPSVQLAEAPSGVHPGLAQLLWGDFHGLSTDSLERSAIAWKVLGPALLNWLDTQDLHYAHTPAGVSQLMTARYGFLSPKRIANWPADVAQPERDRPLGFVHGTLQTRVPSLELEVANTGCTTCHSGMLYDSAGRPSNEAWVGLPSSSINMDRYALEVYSSLKLAVAEEDSLFETMKKVFPEVSEAEIKTIQRFYLPQVAARIEELSSTTDQFTPYKNGSPGLTNGVATIQFYLGSFGSEALRQDQYAYTSIPGLAGLGHRSSVLWDGVYVPEGRERFGFLEDAGSDAHRDGLAGVVIVVTLGTLGVHPERAVTNIPEMREVIDYLFDEYSPPLFPGEIDTEEAQRGQELFAARCSRCHGSYEEVGGQLRVTRFPNYLAAQAEIQTDSGRWDRVTDEANSGFDQTPLGSHIDVARTGGYVAPPLSAIWATAPYLHNGSVPTLWHLLHPEERPERFMTGGHMLDLEKVGVAGQLDASGTWVYAEDYTPWSLPEIYDTTEPGHGHQGHSLQLTGLSEADKDDILEYLKQL